MATATEINIEGYDEIQRLLKQLADSGISNVPLFNEIGLFLIAKIKLRTAEGMDAEDQRFKPYSARHAAKRASLGLPISHVDLFFTGSMLSSMLPTAERNQVRVFFAPTQDKFGGFNPAKAFFINEDQGREFFAISDKEADEIIEMAARKMEAMLEESA